ncbi:MAG: RnfABCDGE type electron transport complex subunit G [Candidatus Omnitrophica bacterium]|nr:RnfABCDGE type electron transport complex subunit G [Candidatus Omnitrophota bacterium]
MKEMTRYGFILGLICVLAAGLLAGVNALTRVKIADQAKAEEQAALKEVMPQAAKFTPVGQAEEVLYYKAFDSDDQLVGFIFKASEKGYSSVIQTLAGMNLQGVISAIKVISQNETPGLGMRITENKFTGQFKNQDTASLSGVQAITGATISSRAVMDSVIKKAQVIKELIKNGK